MMTLCLARLRLIVVALLLVASHAAPAVAQRVTAPVLAERVTATSLTPEGLRDAIARRRGKVVVVNFWASWCPPCRTEFPDIIRVHRDYEARGVDVLAVSMNAPDETEDINRFLATFQPSFPVYRAADPEDGFYQGVSDQWFGELPVTMVVDATGRTVHFHKKPVTYDELVGDLTPLLDRPLPRGR